MKTVTDNKGRFSLFADNDDTLVVVNACLNHKPRRLWTNVVKVNPKSPGALRLVMR